MKKFGCKILEYLDPGDLERDDLLNLEIGNPCPNHPSDHYSIGYTVKLDLNKDQMYTQLVNEL